MSLVLQRMLSDLGLAGTYSSVTEFTLPEIVNEGEIVPFRVSGHLFSEPAWPNFGVGVFYIEGPMDEIALTVDGTRYAVKKGEGVAKYRSPRPGACTTISLDCRIESLVKGTYTFAAVTGYVEDETFYYDDRVDRSVEVKPPPGPEWWALALGVGLASIVVIGGVVAYDALKPKP